MSINQFARSSYTLKQCFKYKFTEINLRRVLSQNQLNLSHSTEVLIRYSINQLIIINLTEGFFRYLLKKI